MEVEQFFTDKGIKQKPSERTCYPIDLYIGNKFIGGALWVEVEPVSQRDRRMKVTYGVYKDRS